MASMTPPFLDSFFDPPVIPHPSASASPSVPSLDDDDVPPDASAEELLSELERLANDILGVRHRPTSSDSLAQISELMESRNRVVDHYQTARASEFREFITSLHLPELHAAPFFQGPCHCVITSDEVTALLNGQPASVPDADIARFIAADEHRRAELTKNLQLIAKKKFTSPTDLAQKTRMEAELAALKQYSPKRR
jgi:hypothetical protein